MIAVSKSVAAVMTGSGSMLAEGIHSFADCANQVLLLVGVKGAAKPATPEHPLGYGRNAYFWSFMVALLLFSVGGMFSIYEGIHKMGHPEAPDHIWVGIGVLFFALVIESWATWSNLKEMKKRRGDKPLVAWLKDTKDSDLVVVFGENSAAVLGLLLALAALGLSGITGDGRFDATGSMMIGFVLIAVAVFLAVEVKSLLLGETADPEIEASVREIVAADNDIEEVFNVLTIQQGPGEVMLAVKIRLGAGLTANEVAVAINQFEVAIKEKCPEVQWSFVEPDIHD